MKIFWRRSVFRVGVLYVLIALVVAHFMDRRPMAVNVLNHLQDVPVGLVNAAGQGMSLTGKQVDAAIRYFRERIFLTPDDVVPYATLGYLYNSLDERNFALGQYRKALSLSPNLAGVRYNIAVLHYKTGDYRHAYQDLAAIFQTTPTLAPPGAVCFLPGGGMLTNSNAAPFFMKIKLFVEYGKDKDASGLKQAMDELFQTGMFYFATVRVFQHDGKVHYQWM